MPQTEYAIQLEHVTKTFGPVIANHDVTMNIRRGEILSLLGETGSGKTTLMNMIAGIYFPDEGEIYVGDEAVTIRSPRDALDLGIGMITPPVGNCLYVACGMSKRLSFEQISKACIPYIVMLMIALLLITYVEPISMGLIWLTSASAI